MTPRKVDIFEKETIYLKAYRLEFFFFFRDPETKKRSREKKRARGKNAGSAKERGI